MKEKNFFMKGWDRLRDFVGKTLSFSYIKSLIADKSNENLREFIGLVLIAPLVYIIIHAEAVAKDDASRLNVIYATMGFILILFGIDVIGKMQGRMSDNKTKREIEIEKSKHPKGE